MRGVLVRWLVNALGLFLISYVIRGIEVDGFLPALIAAALLGLINAVLRPLIILITLPINILTLGLFTFLINGFLLYIVGEVVRGFHVSGFWSAVFGAFILSLLSGLMTALIGREGKIRSVHIHLEE
ncbi:MAG TPA: phage holin family protein [Nitrospiria bacterium]|nr:phage holin family protein [Nitrospiria bacterium]